MFTKYFCSKIIMSTMYFRMTKEHVFTPIFDTSISKRNLIVLYYYKIKAVQHIFLDFSFAH